MYGEMDRDVFGAGDEVLAAAAAAAVAVAAAEGTAADGVAVTPSWRLGVGFSEDAGVPVPAL
jgi:hypothetical protein